MLPTIAVGSAIYLIGNFLNDHGRYIVSLEAESIELNGKANYTIAEGLLFFAAGLDATLNHTLTITNADDQFLDIIRTVIVSDPTPKRSSTSSVTSAGTTGVPLPTSSSESTRCLRILTLLTFVYRY